MEQLTFLDCLRLPVRRWPTAFSYYWKLHTLPGTPPGTFLLCAAIIKAMARKDRRYVDLAMQELSSTMAQDVCFRLSGKALHILGFKEEGLHRLREAVRMNPSGKNTADLADFLNGDED